MLGRGKEWHDSSEELKTGGIDRQLPKIIEDEEENQSAISVEEIGDVGNLDLSLGGDEREIRIGEGENQNEELAGVN